MRSRAPGGLGAGLMAQDGFTSMRGPGCWLSAGKCQFSTQPPAAEKLPYITALGLPHLSSAA